MLSGVGTPRKEGGMKPKQVTIHTLQQMKQRGSKITMLTAYDATFARLLNDSHVDIILVGDSLGMVVQGHQTTLPVTVEDIVYHTRAVARVANRPHIVADMPFMSYQGSDTIAIENAGRMLKEGGAHAVKLEVSMAQAPLVVRIVECGIPVMGHIGLKPQSVHQMGGFRVQGKDSGSAAQILDDAFALQEAGAYALVVEGVPLEVAHEISTSIQIPTIGIGAGPLCDGQVLVLYDLLGMDDSFKPKFVRRFENLGMRIRTAVNSFVDEVQSGTYPGEHESISRSPTTPQFPPSNRQRGAKPPVFAYLRTTNAGATSSPAMNRGFETTSRPAPVSAITQAGGCAPVPGASSNDNDPVGDQ